ncbi:hypothetical protein NDU88_001822 [Pleurodeles waltl]|uniref:Receptor ligand binding region domain-containing protein n=2 Tax=Pleurodeles waltl TaxID=8319 RepID=A0AAV7M0Q1_PLEWA|nr:hypothetical protein NDU88_001819 [Pleurodeles waltl]KAJ1096689.1 hypothetical protein NDU88_001822 [Pleurodeles waltl]
MAAVGGCGLLPGLLPNLHLFPPAAGWPCGNRRQPEDGTREWLDQNFQGTQVTNNMSLQHRNRAIGLGVPAINQTPRSAGEEVRPHNRHMKVNWKPFNLLRFYGISAVSYGAMDTIFNNRVLFPAFYRTVPSELMQHEVIIKLLKHFGWTWVGMIVSEDEISQGAIEQLRAKLMSNGICVDFSIRLIHKMDLLTPMQTVRKSTANVIIIYSNTELFYFILLALEMTSVPDKVFIIPASLAFVTEHLAESYLKRLNGSLIVSVPKREIPGLKEYLSNASPVKTPNNPFLDRLWYRTFSCYPNGTKKSSRKICEDDISLRNLEASLYDVDNFRLTFSVYAAVHAVARALHNLHFSDLEPGKLPNNLKKTFLPWQVKFENVFTIKNEL